MGGLRKFYRETTEIWLPLPSPPPCPVPKLGRELEEFDEIKSLFMLHTPKV